MGVVVGDGSETGVYCGAAHVGLRRRFHVPIDCESKRCRGAMLDAGCWMLDAGAWLVRVCGACCVLCVCAVCSVQCAACSVQCATTDTTQTKKQHNGRWWLVRHSDTDTPLCIGNAPTHHAPPTHHPPPTCYLVLNSTTISQLCTELPTTFKVNSNIPAKHLDTLVCGIVPSWVLGSWSWSGRDRR
jgi:hypothetical protein